MLIKLLYPLPRMCPDLALGGSSDKELLRSLGPRGSIRHMRHGEAFIHPGAQCTFETDSR
jgi:hypothetical protein